MWRLADEVLAQGVESTVIGECDLFSEGVSRLDSHFLHSWAEGSQVLFSSRAPAGAV